MSTTPDRARRPAARGVPRRRAAALVLGLLLLMAAASAGMVGPARAATRPAQPIAAPVSRPAGTVPSTVAATTGPGMLVRAEGAPGDPDTGVRKIGALAGYVAYGLMALTVVWGILITTGFARRGVRRATLYGGHMLLAVVTLVFSVVHAIVYVFQTRKHFTPLNAVVPFVAGGESGVAFGIIGTELAVAVAVSVWVQRRLSYRRWHLVHYLAYPAFALSALHVYTTSGEARTTGLLGLTVAVVLLAVVVMAVLRMLPATTLVRTRIAPVEP